MIELTTSAPFDPRPAPLPNLEPERIFPAKYQVTVLFESACRWRLVEEYGVERFTVGPDMSLINISQPTRLLSTSEAVFCLKKKKKQVS